MKINKLWYLVTLVALAMLPLVGCSGGGSGDLSPVKATEKGTQITVGGQVDTAALKTTGKSVALSPYSTVKASTVYVIDAQVGTVLTSGAVDSDGKFSNLTFTLPTSKSILVFKAVTASGALRSIVPIDLSSPPATGVIVASQPIVININATTNAIAQSVSKGLGLTGLLGDGGQTLASVSKTYTDALTLVQANGGVVLSYSNSGALALTGNVGTSSSSVLLPARDAATLTFDDLRDIALDAKIISVFVPGDKPVVNFQVVNKATGKGITGLRTFSLHFAQLVAEANGSASYWQNYIAAGLPITAMPATTSTAISSPTTDSVTSFNADGTVKGQGYSVVDNGDGSYSVTFGANIKANTNVKYDATLVHRFGLTVRSVAVPGNYRLPTGLLSPTTATAVTPGAYGGAINPLTGAVIAAFTNTNGAAAVYDFTPSTGAVYKDATSGSPYARDIVTIAACNQCHYRLEFGSNNTSGHFGSRPDTKICVMCHTNQLAIVAGETEGAGATVGTGNFTMFVHQIHMGKELFATASGLAKDYGANTGGYPMDIRNCTFCHKGADVNNWNTKATRNACGSCHNNIDFATGANHGMGGAKADDKACSTCHDSASVKSYHVLYDKTTNNTTIPSTVADMQYTITSATLNAKRQPVITFTIKKNGTDVTLDTAGTDKLRRLPLGLQGFKGGPTIGVYFGMPQDGITAPNDFNGPSLTASLTNLWRGLGGTLVKNADGTFTATITGTVSGTNTITVTIPTTATVITAVVNGTFTQAVPFKAYSTGNESLTAVPSVLRNSVWKTLVVTATGNTARRPIVSNALCNKCHDQLGIKPAFHSGTRNDATACAVCHNTSRSSGSWNSGSSNFVHALHGAGKRTVPFKWHAAVDYQLWTVVYPGVLKNCEQCHLTGTYDFSATASSAQVSNLFFQTVATGVPTTPATPGALPPYVTAGVSYGTAYSFTNSSTNTRRVTIEAGSSSLVNSPISSACYACHDTKQAKGHMEQNGGSIYAKRSDVFNMVSSAGVKRSYTTPKQVEACLVCHGGISSSNAFNATAPNIKQVHRWW